MAKTPPPPPPSGKELLKEATELFRNQQYKEALEVLSKVTNDDPMVFAQALAFIGRCHTRLQDYATAVDLLRYAYEQKPLALTQYYLGEAYYHAGDADNAMEALESAINQDTKLTDAFILLGTLRRQAGQYDEAIKSFNMALRNDPKAVAARFQLAQTSYDTGDLQRASSQAYMIVQQSPDFGPVHLLLGHCALRLNDFRQAASEYCTVLTLQEPTLEIYEGLGRAFANLKDFPQALKAFEAVIQMQPDHEMAWVAAARLADRMGEPEKAKTLWTGTLAFPKYADLATEALAKLGASEAPPTKGKKKAAPKPPTPQDLPRDFTPPPQLDRSQIGQRLQLPTSTAPLTTHAAGTLSLASRSAPTAPITAPRKIELPAPEPQKVGNAFQQLIRPYAEAISQLMFSPNKNKNKKKDEPEVDEGGETIADMMSRRRAMALPTAPLPEPTEPDEHARQPKGGARPKKR